MSNILRVVVEDVEEETPVVPDTDGSSSDAVTPDTGSFTVVDATISPSGFDFVTILPMAALSLAIFSVLLIFIAKFHYGKKIQSSFKLGSRARKILFASFAVGLVFGIVGLFSNAFLRNYEVKAAGETLGITTTDTTINVTKETEANYALATTEITLNEPTAAGYDLYVYAPSGNKLKPELSTQEGVISSVGALNSALSSNTYGVTVSNSNIDVAGEIWSPLSESEESPLLIVSYSEATNVNDKITFYYGVLIGQDLPAGTYTTEIEYKAVPHYYTITFDPNDGILDDASRAIVAGATLGDLPTPTRTNYVFDGWYTEQTGGEQITTSTIPPQSTTYYAHWLPSKVTFVAGANIERILITNAANNYKPLYVSPDHPVTIEENYTAGTKYMITIVPKANYILGSWAGDTSGLASTSLLTTSYTLPASGIITLTAVGEQGSYTTMQDLDLASCIAGGLNVTDARDNRAYTVAKIGDYCYMLDNLKLGNTTNDAARVLTIANSDIIADTSFTMPTETWRNQSQDYYCKPIMAASGGEYYYNWYAAKANPYECASPTSYEYATAENDARSLGSICPKGWTLPDYVNDLTPELLWDNGTNPGALFISGTFSSGSQNIVGNYNGWWSSTRNDETNYLARHLYMNGASIIISDTNKSKGLSVRCLRSL